MKKQKIYYFFIVMILLSSCSSDLDYDFDFSNNNLENIDYYDSNNQTFLSGSCVIGSIQYAGSLLNIYYPSLCLFLNTVDSF